MLLLWLTLAFCVFPCNAAQPAAPALLFCWCFSSCLVVPFAGKAVTMQMFANVLWEFTAVSLLAKHARETRSMPLLVVVVLLCTVDVFGRLTQTGVCREQHTGCLSSRPARAMAPHSAGPCSQVSKWNEATQLAALATHAQTLTSQAHSIVHKPCSPSTTLI